MKHCEALQLFDGITLALSISLTSLLFFLRIRAVYAGHNAVIFFFFFLWLSVAATSLTPLFGFGATNIPGTPYCINNSFKLHTDTILK